MDRSTARACAMKLIYEWELGGDGGEDTLTGLLELKPNENESDFMLKLVELVKANVEKIDALIAGSLRGWSFDRLSKVDLAIMRIAVCEMTEGLNTIGVVINEAVELAAKYSTDKAGAFINGVLGSIGRRETNE